MIYLRPKVLRFCSHAAIAMRITTGLGTLLWPTLSVTEQRADYVARGHFDRGQAFRSWTPFRGDVYVPIDEPLNPYLKNVPEWALKTLSGKQLTLINCDRR